MNGRATTGHQAVGAAFEADDGIRLAAHTQLDLQDDNLQARAHRHQCWGVGSPSIRRALTSSLAAFGLPGMVVPDCLGSAKLAFCSGARRIAPSALPRGWAGQAAPRLTPQTVPIASGRVHPSTFGANLHYPRHELRVAFMTSNASGPRWAPARRRGVARNCRLKAYGPGLTLMRQLFDPSSTGDTTPVSLRSRQNTATRIRARLPETAYLGTHAGHDKPLGSLTGAGVTPQRLVNFRHWRIFRRIYISPSEHPPLHKERREFDWRLRHLLGLTTQLGLGSGRAAAMSPDAPPEVAAMTTGAGGVAGVKRHSVSAAARGTEGRSRYGGFYWARTNGQPGYRDGNLQSLYTNWVLSTVAARWHAQPPRFIRFMRRRYR